MPYEGSTPYEVAAAKYDRIISQSKCHLNEDCAICLQSLFLKAVNYLPCKHYFHADCLNQAFKSKLYTCPLCRYDLLEPLRKTGFIFPQETPHYYNSDFDFELWQRLFLSLLAEEPQMPLPVPVPVAVAVAAPVPIDMDDADADDVDYADMPLLVDDDFPYRFGSIIDGAVTHDFLIFYDYGSLPPPPS